MTLKRKAHRKSRTGCSTCKRRRIKCDEVKPSCSHCVRHEVSCVYPQDGQGSSALAQTPGSNQSTPRPAVPSNAPTHVTTQLTTGPFQPSSSQSSFELGDMALLHHWSLKTSLSIVNCPQQSHLWQMIFPQIAFRHSYMMHGILSLAALHLTYLYPPDRQMYLHRATHHHTLALSGFREDINRITPSNADGLFGTATLLFFHAFLTFGKAYNDNDEMATSSNRTSRILGIEWIPLTRGIQAVLTPTYAHVKKGPLSSTLDLKHWAEIDPDENPGPDDVYLLRIRETWADDENASVYDETLHLLRRAGAWVAHFESLDAKSQSAWGHNRDWSAPFIWLSMAPERFLTLQRQRQPVALLVFAYFGILLQRLDRYWWTEGCGRSIIVVIDDILGPFWSTWMEWPMHVVGA
ncbi:hypothetical protein T440DRAFT_470186 [Plenodomus tracheiphilus IPT5]|uniref:Zn(2)-C6 fungal-type domain-containing protein n=1 Tax=Plenodomus tracheiphilus IPT5 TaxID=1408161 RepID=A0A6A7B2M5_9PLEO|nr:hypothetical protein T440DRAFT_470186 [Plenodomus tracheiphilus IPT5]